MKKRILIITIGFILVMAIITIIFCVNGYKNSSSDALAKQLVNINEIKQLINNGELEKANLVIDNLDNYLREINNKFDPTLIILNATISSVFVIVVFLYVYFSILRPFDKLKGFANQISAGNFNIPLNYEKSNYFGKFTWAFDSMRSEIIKARKCEAEAIENNKTVIASLSHDIKTPIASILAYSEALEANIESDYETRVKYLNVIENKAMEVKKLTDDLFLHSISEMDKISFNSEKLDLVLSLNNSINDFKANATINLNESLDFAYIMADKLRIAQIFENIINNSIKYANTKIDVSLKEDSEYYLVSFRDYGPGINDEEIPFIFDKFYRGKNSVGINGTGLGLYIVKYMIEKMNGKVELISNNGLLIKLFFKKLISKCSLNNSYFKILVNLEEKVCKIKF